MVAPAIHVRGIGKRYRLGQMLGAGTLAETITESVRTLGARITGSDSVPRYKQHEAESRYLWALRDVSFDIEAGEVVGVLGPNGAGKTTLLKILARVTDPTTGRAELRGRVGSLLEIGVGFHGELTGRENVYLSGAVLGMKRAEIAEKYGEIVSFAGVERFLETPMKRYSAGMQARLAFAVAAYLEPEILLVDEMLSVGDVSFQKKCIGKMGEVASEGRTVLFVSHNMAYVHALCERGILMREGRVVVDGSVDQAIDAYLDSGRKIAQVDISSRKDRQGTGEARLLQVEVRGGGHDAGGTPLQTGAPAAFVFRVDRVIGGMGCLFGIYDFLGQQVAAFDSAIGGPEDSVETNQQPTFVCEVDELLLTPGKYRLDAWLSSGGELLDRVEAAMEFDVEEGVVRGRPVSGVTHSARTLIPHRWTRPPSSLERAATT